MSLLGVCPAAITVLFFCKSSMVSSLPIILVGGGESVGSIDVPDILSEYNCNDHVLHLVVKSLMARKHCGTHKSKERSDVSGSTKKYGSQKGGGGARHGDKNSPVFVGGGRVFGPVPRSYDIRVNKKERKQALLSVIKYKLEQNNVVVVDDFVVDDCKTKTFVSVVSGVGMLEQLSVLVYDNVCENLYLGSRNISNIVVRKSSHVSVLDIMSVKKVFFTKCSFVNFLKRLE